jgi:hypothetical protein
MKLNIVAALFLVGMTVRAYEEENFLGPRWGDRPKNRAEIYRAIAEKYQRKTIYTSQELEEESGKIQLDEREQIVADVIQHPAEMVDSEPICRMPDQPLTKNTPPVQEVSEPPFYIRHRNKLIIGGVVAGAILIRVCCGGSSKSE